MENKKEKQMPPRQIKVTIGPNDYIIVLPVTGDLIDIEAAKIRMTGGTGKDMVFGGGLAQNAYVAVEAIATFEILLPKLTKDLNVDSLAKLDPLQSKNIVKAYEKYYEWITSWNIFLNDDIEEKKEGDA